MRKTGDMAERVLVVSPRQDANLFQALERAGFEAIAASSSEEGMRLLYECRPCAVIMTDDVLPVAGKQLHTRLRQISVVPCIVLGHKNNVERAMTIENGADLYLDSSTSHDTLIAHLRSLVKRYHRREGPTKLDTQKKTVTLGDSSVQLTDTEFRLFSCLSFNGGMLVPYPMLLAEVWGRETAMETLHQYVRRLKRKLGIDSVGPCRLLNQRGVGYCFCADKA